MTITVNLDDCELHAGGKTVVITRQQARIVRRLLEASPHFVNLAELSLSAAAGDGKHRPNKHVSVQVHLLRKRLMAARMPVVVMNRHNVGYQIHETAEATLG